MNPRFDIETLTWRAGEVARVVPAGELFGWLLRSLPVPAGWAALALRAGLDPLLTRAGEAVKKEAVEEVLFVRATPLEAKEQAEVQSSDGCACQGSVKVPLRVVLENADLAALRRTLLGVVDSLAMAGLQRYLQWPLRQVLSDLAAAHTAAELLKPLDAAMVQRMIHEKLGALCLAAGLKIDGAAEVVFESPAYREHLRRAAEIDRQKQHVAARQQIQEALATAQRERLSHLSELLERMRELSAATGVESMLELLRRFDDTERGEMYAALWHLVAPAKRTRLAAAVSGQELLLFEPEAFTRPVRRFRLPETLGALRSISAAGAAEPDTVLIGAACGVYAVDLETEIIVQTLAGDVGEPGLRRGGFNSVVMTDGEVYATHSELGLMSWPRDGGVPTILCADVTCKAATVRCARVFGGALWFAAGSTLWRQPLEEYGPRTAYSAGSDPITAVAIAPDTAYAGNSAGGLLAWPVDSPDEVSILRQDSGDAIESIHIVETAGVRRLVFADCSKGLTAMVVGDHYARRYESPLRIRRAAAAGDFFLAMNDTRDRLVAWRPDRPGGPVGNVIIPHLTGGNVQDICLIPA